METQAVKENSKVFAGENWFFYWKTSASLWSQLFEQAGAPRRFLIPINWSFHMSRGGRVDFGSHRPETDLVRLHEMAQKFGHKLAFLFPLGPMPFLPNGGVPSDLVDAPLIDERGLKFISVNNEGQVYQMYSFFASSVAEGLSFFAKECQNYFTRSKLGVDIWGIEGHWVQKLGGPQHLFNDHSESFDKAFQIYLKNNQKDLQTLKQQNEALSFRVKFIEDTRSFYEEMAKGQFENNWEGKVDVSFLGLSQDFVANRLTATERTSDVCHELFESMGLSTLPSSLLIPNVVKNQVLDFALDRHVTQGLSLKKFHADLTEEGGPLFSPLSFFKVYDHPADAPADSLTWADYGLWDVIQEDYGWCYQDKSQAPFNENEEELEEGPIVFVHGMKMEVPLFLKVLKAFMSGGKIIIDRSFMSREIQKKFEGFLLENNLQVEKIQYKTLIHHITLGSGRLVLMEGEKLFDLELSEAHQFWKKILSTFEVNHLKTPFDEGPECFWSKREVSNQEVAFEEVRRMSFYNPTSYKKKWSLSLPKTYKLLKIVDAQGVEVQTSPSQLHLEALPQSSVALDFGVFYE